MKKTIMIISSIVLLMGMRPIYAFSNITENMEFEVGLNAGQSNYHIDTNVNSILKWRDMNSIGGNASIKYNYSPDLNFKLGLNYSNILSGEMTDDDLVNTIGGGYGDGEMFAYSKTKNMKGHELKLDLDASHVFYSKGNNNVSVLLGVRYQENTYKPNTLYQIVIDVEEGAYPYFDAGQSQHTKSIFYGPTVGISFERASETQSFTTSLKGFVALKPISKQSEWGYDWDIKGKMGSVYGVDFNMSQGLKMTEKLWLNMFANFEYLYGSNSLTETGTSEDPSYKVGDIRSLQNYKAILGVSLKIK